MRVHVVQGLIDERELPGLTLRHAVLGHQRQVRDRQHQSRHSGFQQPGVQRWIQAADDVVDARRYTSGDLNGERIKKKHQRFNGDVYYERRDRVTRTSTISNGTVLLLTVPAMAVRLAARAWQDRSTAMHGGARPVASSTHLEYKDVNLSLYRLCVSCRTCKSQLCKLLVRNEANDECKSNR